MKRPIIEVHQKDDELAGTAYVFIDSIIAILNVKGVTSLLLNHGYMDISETADDILKRIENTLNKN